MTLGEGTGKELAMAFFQNSKDKNKFDDVTFRGMRDQQWSDKKDEMKDMRRNARGFFN